MQTTHKIVHTTVNHYRPRYNALLRETLLARTEASKNNDWETFRVHDEHAQALTVVIAHQKALTE